MEDLRITRLVLNNVGVFEHLDLSFEKKQLKDKAEIHIFTGENGTGKTTLLEAMTYFDAWFNKSLLEENNKDDSNYLYQKLYTSRKVINSENLSIKVYFQEKEIEFYASGENPFIVNSDFFEFYYNANKNATSVYRRYSFFAYSGQRQLNNTKIEAFKSYEFNPLAEALTFNKTHGNTNLFQWIANNKTRSALSFQKGNKKDSEEYLASILKIENAVGEIIGRKVEFIIDEYSLNVMVKLDNESIHYNTLPDGYKSVISWLTDLMFRLDYITGEGKENFTLFLDEIDIHLHPAAQRRILPVIQKLFPKAQIFLTTHSPFVIGSVDDAWVYKFKLDETGNSVLDGEPFLTEDARSYRYILEQVFDINKQFGIEVEKQLDDFYKKRDEVIKKPSDSSLKELEKSSRDLALQGDELRAIMGNELKQLSRILKKEITL